MWKVVLLLYLLVLSVFDWKEKRVPLVWLVLGLAVATGGELHRNCFGQGSLLKTMLGLVPGAFLLGVSFVTGKAGYADGMVMLIVGMAKGYKAGLFVLCIGLFLASVVSVILLLMRKVCRQTRIPFIPFLTAAFWIWEVLPG